MEKGMDSNISFFFVLFVLFVIANTIGFLVFLIGGITGLVEFKTSILGLGGGSYITLVAILLKLHSK